MPTIDPRQTYEVHRPLDEGSMAYQAIATLLMTPAVKALFYGSLERAGGKTSGPVMAGNWVGCTNGKDLDKLYWESLKEGLDPCYQDPKDGFVHIGGAVFVPVNRHQMHVDTDILTQ